MDEDVSQLPATTERAVASYYSKDYGPLFERCADDCAFIGAGNDIFANKEQIERALSTPDESPLLLMRNAQFRLVGSPDPNAREAVVFGTYHLYTAPNESSLFATRQRITVCFRRSDEGWLAYHIHASNEWSEPVGDDMFPLAVSQETYQYVRNILRTGRKAGLLPTRITLENGGATQYLEPDWIVCIQASGKRSIVHTAEGSLEFEGLLRDIEPQLPGVFLRVHRSYLVNAAHVLRLRRFALELSNGMEVPVPERRFTAVQRELSLRLADSPRAEAS